MLSLFCGIRSCFVPMREEINPSLTSQGFQSRCTPLIYGLPADVRFDHGDADQEEHEHGEGHHGEAQQHGSVLADAGPQRVGPSPLPSTHIPASAPLHLLGRRGVEELPASRAHTHTQTQTKHSYCMNTCIVRSLFQSLV